MIPHYNCVPYLQVKELGLHSAYIHQQQVRAYIRELMALPHLPANHIIPAFQQLKERCPRTNEKLLGLLSYFDVNWVNSTSRPPTSWSVFKRVVQTKNDVEGWHYRLNSQSPHDRPNLYVLLGLLHKEATLLPLQVKLVSQKKIYRRQRKEHRSREEKLRKLWDEYAMENRTLTTSDFLRQVSQLSESDHSED